MSSILVTDTLFILPEHERQLQAAGFSTHRLPKLKADEAELAEAIKGKDGYILGGVERVTRPVIDAADRLKAIVFCGTDYQTFIPAWEHASDRGIMVANVPDGHTHAVAEWALSAALVMSRDFFGLGRTGAVVSATTPGLEGQTVGIVGLGHIGSRIAAMLKPFRPGRILYASNHRHADVAADHQLHYATLPSLLRQSDVVFLCVSLKGNTNFFGREQFNLMKNGAVLVSFMQPGVINADALHEALATAKVKVASDYPIDPRFQQFPASTYYCGNESNAFNTTAGVRYTSDRAVQKIISLLGRP